MIVLSFVPKGAIPTMDKEQEQRNEEPKPRSIILPMYVWDMVEKDAKRCRRSINKQIEAILVVFYGIESSVNIDEDTLISESNTRNPKLKKTA